jgi:hypothetical protein
LWGYDCFPGVVEAVVFVLPFHVESLEDQAVPAGQYRGPNRSLQETS